MNIAGDFYRPRSVDIQEIHSAFGWASYSTKHAVGPYSAFPTIDITMTQLLTAEARSVYETHCDIYRAMQEARHGGT